MVVPPIPPSGDDEQFNNWLTNRQPPPDDAIPASVAFMALMRQAAERARKSPRAQEFEKTLHPAEPAAVPLAHVPADYQPEADAPLPPAFTPPPDLPERPRRRRPRPEFATGSAAAGDTAANSTTTADLIADLEAVVAPAKPLPTTPPRKRSAGRARGVRRTVGVVGGVLRSAIIVSAAALLTATIFTWWTPTGFLPGGVRADLSIAIATSAAAETGGAAVGGSVPGIPAAIMTPNYARVIGVVSGHRGPQNDPGAVCPDGLTEAEINFAVAERVVDALRARGYSVDLLDEFDARLDNYQAAALVSIHANTCRDFGELVTGYLVAGPAARITTRGSDQLLVDCISRHYGSATGLQRHEGVTMDMTHYHNFRAIHPLTPAAILELGFMLADRDVLTNHQDAMARGVIGGILCFIEPAALAPQLPVIVPLTTPTPAPTP